MDGVFHLPLKHKFNLKVMKENWCYKECHIVYDCFNIVKPDSS